jgi:hypothetical protein
VTHGQRACARVAPGAGSARVSTQGAKPCFQFVVPLFARPKLKMFALNLKISKYESCRTRNPLQLSQRATYVFLNRSPRKSLQSLCFSWRGQGDIQTSIEILEAFPLGISNAAN